LLFQCSDGEMTFNCQATEGALEGIVQLHGLDINKDESFDVIASEIEQVLNQKRNDVRLEPDGSIVARKIDILRYGTVADAAVGQARSEADVNSKF
jgi:hypothetical protein